MANPMDVEAKARELLAAEVGCDADDLESQFIQREAALRAIARALEAAREDAERWRHARKLLTIDDIEGAQGAFDSFGGLVSEDECKRADAAIDQARGKGVGGD